MSLAVTLNVKFRFFGLDFGRIDRRFVLPLPARVMRLLSFSERGVTLTVDAVEGGSET